MKPLTTKDKASIERFIAATLKKAAEHGRNAADLEKQALVELTEMGKHAKMAAEVAERYKANMKPQLKLVKDDD